MTSGACCSDVVSSQRATWLDGASFCRGRTTAQLYWFSAGLNFNSTRQFVYCIVDTLIRMYIYYRQVRDAIRNPFYSTPCLVLCTEWEENDTKYNPVALFMQRCKKETTEEARHQS